MKPASYYRRSLQYGLTMVELMIALAVGLFLTGMISAIFVAGKGSNRYQEAMSRMQESARYAMDYMGRTIRNAGYQGCGSISKFANTINGGTSNWWLNLSSPLIGYEGGVSTYPTQIVSTSPVSPVANTDAFVTVGFDDSDNLAVTGHNAPSAQIDTTTHSIKPGTVLVITDCAQTTVFQMSGPTNNNNNASNVVHNEGNTISPGNCYKGLGASCSATEKNYTFQPGASILRLASNAFYIRPSSTTANVNSLWTVALGNDASGNVTTLPQEIAEGVENMQIEYGEDTDSDGVPNRYVTANNVSAWPNVITVRVSLLMATLENNLSSGAQTYTYNGTTTTATDRRVRRTFTSVFALRNRAK
jgi:type IV pilus assembly protein PilW